MYLGFNYYSSMAKTAIFSLSCTSSPGGAEAAITVGASTLDDGRASFSNHGPCVDVFAPGVNVSISSHNRLSVFDVYFGPDSKHLAHK